jgi:general secretion pathway protein G
MKRVTGNQKGFTLVELMVVISILAILVSIAVASYSVSLAEAKNVACQYNLRVIRDATVLYKNLNDQKEPDSLDDMVPEFIRSGFKFECPDTRQPYQYDSGTGGVQCTTPGHEY